MYEHFMLLWYAITCLVRGTVTQVREQALKMFVKKCHSIYGREFMSFNVHTLIHLVDDFKNFGPLESVSAFSFENYLGCLKRKIRCGNKPSQQLINRLNENPVLTSVKKVAVKRVPSRDVCYKIGDDLVMRFESGWFKFTEKCEFHFLASNSNVYFWSKPVRYDETKIKFDYQMFPIPHNHGFVVFPLNH